MNRTPTRNISARTLKRGRIRRAPQPHLLDLVPEYLTRQQAANIAGVATRTIDRWLRDPEVALTIFHSGRGGRRPVLLSREELRALLTVHAAEDLAAQQDAEG
jgi:hypothetical protein